MEQLHGDPQTRVRPRGKPGEGRGGPRLFGEAEVLNAEALSYPTQPCAFLPNPSIFPCHCSRLLALGGQRGEDTSSLKVVSVGDKGPLR